MQPYHALWALEGSLVGGLVARPRLARNHLDPFVGPGLFHFVTAAVVDALHSPQSMKRYRVVGTTASLDESTGRLP